MIHPKAIIKVPGFLQDDEIERLRRSFEEFHSNPSKHGVLILENGMEYIPIESGQTIEIKMNCPNCGGQWNGHYCAWHMHPRREYY